MDRPTAFADCHRRGRGSHGLQYGFGTTKASPTISMFSATAGVGDDIPLASFLAFGIQADGGVSYRFFRLRRRR